MRIVPRPTIGIRNVGQRQTVGRGSPYSFSIGFKLDRLQDQT
jgi:hypothetical protein